MLRQWNGTLEVAERQAQDRFARANPRSYEFHMAAQKNMPGGNTRTSLHYDPFPLFVERSDGAYIEDMDGHRYLDALGEFTAGLYGHSDSVVRSTVLEILDRGISNGAPGRGELELAELLTSRFPSVEKVRFCNSGTEANLYALTAAKLFTGRSKVMVFRGAYHGGVFVFANGGNPMNLPFDWVVGSYNDVDGTREIIRASGSELAAIIIEPMMSNCGCITADPVFMQMLRAESEAAGAILIFDEVVTSRMAGGGLQERMAISPDLTTFGKYIGGGFSFGAFGGRGEIMELFNPGNANAMPHAGTFNNNVFSMNAGAAGLREVFTPERAARLYDDGEQLRQQLNERCGRVSNSVQFTGCGSTMNIHFVPGELRRPEDLRGEAPGLKKIFHLDMLEFGVSVARRGQINLSLPMGSAEFANVIEAVGKFLERRADLVRGV